MDKFRVLTLVVAALGCSSTGCLDVYSTRPVDIIVTRTDTGQPAADVPVKVYYMSMMMLNQPRDVEGTTDATGRVTLPMADFLGGPYLRAGTTPFWVPVDTVRDGGLLTYKPTAHPEEPIPTYSVRLIPRRRSFFQILFDQREEKQAGDTSPP
jgi:hypothetical protein